MWGWGAQPASARQSIADKTTFSSRQKVKPLWGEDALNAYNSSMKRPATAKLPIKQPMTEQKKKELKEQAQIAEMLKREREAEEERKRQEAAEKERQ